ncbi:uncharacterized protein [Parasteatoda tepidariorum]|uniref:uncharacterized protein n=1 Tax=Parasteatoda tepidariorum TaxID=114398 RepID=UPI00077FB4C3|nr:protein VASCULAR ASSOCIATED DEATH 1, chloroplastic [Parasteatoda tepidariorum]
MPNSAPITTPTTPPSPLPHSRLARSHNRRFHVRFPGVNSEEHLLNYYSCALVADILLQGHLYITENYFAFYSNIFGRKTQILLPVTDVIKVTKERTAKIIPNAVGLYTVEGKYVFGSLLQRNTTYRLMHHVWLKSADPDSTEEEPTPSEEEPGTSDEVVPPVSPSLPQVVVRPEELPLRRLSRRKSEIFPRISAKAARRHCPPPQIAASSVVDQITLSKCSWECNKGRTSSFSECFTRIEGNVQTTSECMFTKTIFVLLAATLLLVILFLLATILVYRVSMYHNRVLSEDNWTSKSQRMSNYLELLKLQQEAVEKEILRITTTLKNRLNDLGQVRQSIDQISSFTRQSNFAARNYNVDETTIDAQAPS